MLNILKSCISCCYYCKRENEYFSYQKIKLCNFCNGYPTEKHYFKNTKACKHCGFVSGNQQKIYLNVNSS